MTEDSCPLCTHPLAVTVEVGETGFEFDVLVSCTFSTCSFWFRLPKSVALKALMTPYLLGNTR